MECVKSKNRSPRCRHEELFLHVNILCTDDENDVRVCFSLQLRNRWMLVTFYSSGWLKLELRAEPMITNLCIAGLNAKFMLIWWNVKENPVFRFASEGLMSALREFICGDIEPQYWSLCYKRGWFKPLKDPKVLNPLDLVNPSFAIKSWWFIYLFIELQYLSNSSETSWFQIPLEPTELHLCVSVCNQLQVWRLAVRAMMIEWNWIPPLLPEHPRHSLLFFHFDFFWLFMTHGWRARSRFYSWCLRNDLNMLYFNTPQRKKQKVTCSNVCFIITRTQITPLNTFK